MKKHTGKVLSLVLALALVVSSLSSTFVSAAVNTANETKVATAAFLRSSDVLIKQDTDAHAANALVDLPDAANLVGKITYTDANGKKYTNAAAPVGKIDNVKIKDWSTSGVSATQPVTTDGGQSYQIHAVANRTGITTYTATINAKVHLAQNTAIDVTATAVYTVEVVAAGEYEIGSPLAGGAFRILSAKPSVNMSSLAVNNGTVGVELFASTAATAAPGDHVGYAVNGALAKYIPVRNRSFYANANAPTDAEKLNADASDPIIMFTNSGSAKVVNVTGNANAANAPVVANVNVAGISSDGVKGIGTDAVTAVVYYGENNKIISKTLRTATATVVKKYIAVPGDVIQKDVTDGQTYAIVTGAGGHKVFVTGYEVVDTAGCELDSGTIGSFSGSGGVTIKNGTVGAVSGSNILIYGGIVGAVTASGIVIVFGGVIDSITSSSDVGICGGTITKDVNANGTILIQALQNGLDNLGQTITTKAITIGGNVNAVAAVQDYVVTGSACILIDARYNQGKASDNALATVTIKGNVRADYNPNSRVIIGATGTDTTAAITTGNVTSPDITLSGNGKVTIGSLVPTADYSTVDSSTIPSDLTFDDFNSTVASANGFRRIDIENGSAEVTSAVTTGLFSMNEDGGKFKVPALTVNKFEGCDNTTLVIPFGKLFIGTGGVDMTPGWKTTLLATGTSAVGTTVFRANLSGLENAFKIEGITVQGTTVNGDGTYNYNVLEAKLVGLTMDKDAVTVAKGDTATLSVVANPTAASLSAGQSIKWTTPAGSYVSVKGNGGQNMTATVTGIDWSQTNFNNNNNVVVTAQIIDTATGVPANAEVATSTVTVTKAMPNVTVPATASVKVGGTTDVALLITPAAFTASTATWTSSDESIAKVAVNASDCSKATITGVKAGTATVTVVTSVDGTSYTRTIVVTVNTPFVPTGSITIDTRNYTFAPNAIYDIGIKTVNLGTNYIKVTDSRTGSIIKLTKLPSGNYRATALHVGTTYVVVTVYDKNGKELNHASIKFDVVAGVKAHGSACRATSVF